MKTKGNCSFCGNEYSGSGITRHLNNHLKAIQLSKGKAYFHLRIQGKYDPIYWLNLLVEQKTSFEELDRFLRKIWLECCGHLSAFEIDGLSRGWGWIDEEEEDEIMYSKLSKYLDEGTTFSHTYDFGTSTELKGKVQGAFVLPTLSKEDGPIKILARNEAPLFVCFACKKEVATEICTACYYEADEPYFCENCMEKHAETCEGEEYFLPLVNSPRTGVCGYDG